MLEFCAASLAAQNFAVAPALRSHVDSLCAEELDGRLAGSAGERAAARYLYSALREAGVLMLTDSLGQDFRIAGNAGSDEIASQNIVGIVEGADPQLREEYIVVGARYDHLGTHTLMIDGEPVVQVFPGADANASGVAVLIELARMVAQYQGLFRRSILFVGFGAGEQGMAGSWYFVNRAFEQIRDVKAMVDLNALGRGGQSNPFQCFTQLAPVDRDYVFDKTRETPVVTLPTITQRPPLSSDYLSFYERKIPVFLFTTGPAREHRTIKDTPRLLDYAAMESACNYLYHFLQVLSAQDEISTADGDPAARAARAEKVYSVSECDMRPQFFHSNEKHFLQSWVYKYLKYPASAIEQNVQGRVQVGFVVNRDGSIVDVKILRSPDPNLSKEAERVVKMMPKWKPARQGNKTVRSRFNLPVNFRLS